MNATAQKKAILPFLKEYFFKKNFEFSDNYNSYFTKNTEYGGLRMVFRFSAKARSGNTLFEISHHEVENIVLSIGMPNRNLEGAKKGDELLYTVKDSSDNYPYLIKPIKIGSGMQLNYIESYDDIEKWKIAFIDYQENAGAKFITKFSYLPNVQDRLAKLYNNNSSNYLDILCGRTDHLFRFLIISKLCNDPNFTEKLSIIGSRITDPEWIPYFNKLKDKLLTLEPNIS